MKKAKVITIEIEEVPHSYAAASWEKAVRKPLKLNFLTEMDSIPMEESTFTKHTYPLIHFAYGNHVEPFYIRDKDKEAFEELVNAYVRRGRSTLIADLAENVRTYKGKDPVRHMLRLVAEYLKQNEEGEF